MTTILRGLAPQLAATLIVVLVAGGCVGSAKGPPPTAPPDGATSSTAATPAAATPAATTPGTSPAPTGPAPTATPPTGTVPTATAAPVLPIDPWRTAQLRDVRSGQLLVINDLYGKLVVIEPMAIWCTNCRAQQNEAREALARLNSAEIVYISLDVDPNESEPDLARYADEREYPWHFVVASRDVARSLALSFGDQVLSPPSTPEIVVRPDGTAEVSFGLTRAAELEARLAALLP